MLMSALLLFSCAKVSHVQVDNEIVMSPTGSSLTKAVTIPLEPNKTDVNPYLQIEFTQKTTPSEIVDLLWFDVQNSGMGKTHNLGM